jgi:uncharacterized protein (TIGR02996 family)
MLTLTDGHALVRAIIASPQDDILRLVYADWLEENGQGQRTEHLRRRWLYESSPSSHDGSYGYLFGISEQAYKCMSHISVRQSMIVAVTISEVDWLAHGPEIASNHPLQQVTLVGKSPHQAGNYAWLGMRPGDILTDSAHAIDERLIGLGWQRPWLLDREAALAWLSERCIFWARAQKEGD